MTTPDVPFVPAAAAASTDVLAETGGRGRRPRPTALIVGAVALLVLLVAGGAVIASRLAGGGGAQPESVVPDTAVAFAKIDLDPSAGQKIDAFRFANKFPAIGDSLNPDEDLVRALFDFAHEAGELSGIDYDADVKPWMGKRMAIALLPAAGGSVEPAPIVVVQVTDAAAARSGLSKLLAEASPGSGAGFAVSGDYAVIASSEAQAQSAISQAEKAPLAQDEHFTADLEALGEAGVGAAWFDLAGMTDLSLAAMQLSGVLPPPQLDSLLAGGQQAQGRFATLLRFDGPTLELVGHTVGGPTLDPADGAVTNHLADLPATTVAAVSVNHPDRLVEQALDQLSATGPESAQVDALRQMAQTQLGLTLPDDLMTLLGSNLVLALDGEGLAHDPLMGARVVTDPVAALSLIDRLEQVLWQVTGSPAALPRDETADGYVIASTPGYVKALAEDGELGTSARFVDAMPDVSTATVAAYVDVAAIWDATAGQGTPTKLVANLKPLAALGFTATNDGDGEASFLMRLTTR